MVTRAVRIVHLASVDAVAQFGRVSLEFGHPHLPGDCELGLYVVRDADKLQRERRLIGGAEDPSITT